MLTKKPLTRKVENKAYELKGKYGERARRLAAHFRERLDMAKPNGQSANYLRKNQFSSNVSTRLTTSDVTIGTTNVRLPRRTTTSPGSFPTAMFTRPISATAKPLTRIIFPAVIRLAC
jgi:hypothetical protein